jgi:hypothetical protein
MDCGAPQHCAGAGVANVRTCGQQCDVGGVGVLFTFTEAVVGGFETNALALGAILDALVHRLRTVFCGMVSHDCFLP